MKRIAQYIMAGAAAVLAVACEPVEIKVVDSSVPTAVSFSICNEAEIWPLDATRTVNIRLTPEDAVAKKMGVTVSDEKILNIEATDCPCKWNLTAMSEGTVKVSVFADDLKSSEMTFTVKDTKVPESIEMSIDNPAEKWEINSQRTVRISTSPSGTAAKSYGVVSSDTKVLQVEQTQDKTEFTVKAIGTGQASIYAYADELKSGTKLFTVIDSSIPTGVSLSITDEAPEWQIGTTRRVIIHTSPAGTAAKQYNVVSSDCNVLKVISTEDKNVFDIEAVGAGQASIYATADNLQTGLLTFNVFNPDVKPEPEIKVYISKVGSTAAKQDYGDWVKVNYGEQYIISASCNRKDLTLEMYSSDEKVASFSDFGENEWLVTATFPGQTDLQVYVVDEGKEYVSSHEFVVYGEVTFQAECTPVFCVAGFSVVNNPFGELTADIHIDMTLVGWPYDNESKKLRLQVPSYDTRNFSISEDGEYPMIYDFRETSDKMYDTWTGGAIGSGDYYCPHGAELNYVFKLSNSYITGKMLDDPNGERNWQFYTKAAVQTTGVVSYE